MVWDEAEKAAIEACCTGWAQADFGGPPTCGNSARETASDGQLDAVQS